MSLSELVGKVERLTGPDRDIDWDIVEALGGHVRKVTRLGLNGRTPGTWRAFWPDKPDQTRGYLIQQYTKDERSRAKVLALLRALLHTKDEG